MAEEREIPTEILAVRGQPVGFVPGRWGGTFVAVERGYFPVSSTGYRSCTGLVGRPEMGAEEKREFLEKLAEEQDRERAALVRDLATDDRPFGDPISNYITASSAYERGVASGFFATDRQRAELWSGAHRLLYLVTENPVFQPAVDASYPAWNAEHCAKGLEYARELRRLLGCWARGDLREAPPVRMIGTHAYFKLPEKPGGEPRIELGGYTAEFAMGVAPAVRERVRPRNATAGTSKEPGAESMQLGLFEGGSEAKIHPAAWSGPSISP